ncbi:MAG: HDIG domain-containing protein [Bacteroidetes bacterium]|nr:HDIG domain-containing protein [Bacteroidota bacterium]MDA0887990.1 HDIG domain-containing protein [Bacteroidota bacterium]MDA1083944.1 HDIG domain-containing protein [Bacteroidota bacterium]
MLLFYRYQAAFYRAFLCLFTTAVVVYMLPRGASFQYEIQEGKPWQYETLLAPYDFPIQKSKKELSREREALEANVPRYFTYQNKTLSSVLSVFDQYVATLPATPEFNAILINWRTVLEEIYANGVLADTEILIENESIALVHDTRQTNVLISDLFSEREAKEDLVKQLALFGTDVLSESSLQYLLSLVVPNISYNDALTRQFKAEATAGVVLVRGLVTKGTRIIAKGEVVEGEKLQKLQSLQQEFESQTWTQTNTIWIIIGYSLLVFIPVLLLFVFLWRTRPTVFENNKRLTFLCVNVLLMVLLTKAVVDVDPQYVYAVPICMLPLLMRTFFDTRIALFALMITLFLIAFLVPNSYEFIYLQIMAGILASLTVNDLYRRAKLFISVGLIVGLYAVSYIAFTLIHDGNLLQLSYDVLLLFVINGLAILFVQPLIYIFEKVFGLVSDVSLLELSDTNSKLLRELADKAPGTFQHSLQVANIAEAAANAIGANTLLTRVGALYHDIGKMKNPVFFSENQASYSPHDELEPEVSAKIIIDHVLNGITSARKAKLPDRVIDFIRTHHGTTTVLYFLQQAQQGNPEIDVEQFQYPGPKPFSKETAIVMISDGVEAASKSLKEPTAEKIIAFVDKIVNRLLAEKQFLEANITLREIETVKQVLAKKLISSYHLRVSYPE